MATVIHAKHYESGQTYAWRCPKRMKAKPDSWALVKTRFGEKVVLITEVLEMDDEQAASLKKVVAVSKDRDKLHPRPNYTREFWLRKQEAALWKEHGLDISPYLDRGFSLEQLVELRKGLMIGIDASKYADPALRPSEMEKRRWALVCPLATYMGYLPTGLNHEQKAEIYRGIDSRVDVKQYADPKYGHRTMRLLRECLEAGQDISKIKNMSKKEIRAYLQAHQKKVEKTASEERRKKMEPSSAPGASDIPEPGSDSGNSTAKTGA